MQLPGLVPAPCQDALVEGLMEHPGLGWQKQPGHRCYETCRILLQDQLSCFFRRSCLLWCRAGPETIYR